MRLPRLAGDRAIWEVLAREKVLKVKVFEVSYRATLSTQDMGSPASRSRISSERPEAAAMALAVAILAESTGFSEKISTDVN